MIEGNLEILTQLETRLEDISNNFEDIISLIADRFLDEMIELQKDQLKKGENPQGQDLFSIRPYAPATIALKRGKGQPSNKVTFFDHGQLYASIQAKKYNGFVELTANVPQVPELIAKWGEWEGLSDVHIEYLRELMQPYILEEIKRRLDI